MSTGYSSAYPFPHIIIDNFLNEFTLEQILNELTVYNNWTTDNDEYVRNHQIKKYFTPQGMDPSDLDRFSQLAPKTKLVIDYLNSKEILTFLEKLTGIDNLLADTDSFGGGVHKIGAGGKLDIHADFNIHFKNRLHRRINMLIYLNKDWQDSWGGDLELWEKDLSKCVSKIKPIFNRAVIFNITDDAYHGHPHPLTTPPEISRYSLAMYYYTQDRPEHEKAPWHPVMWKSI
jgi:Rps23 Pro-64 3,4-dihydroxylase Tpa1-like proline 4-hydroxylase